MKVIKPHSLLLALCLDASAPLAMAVVPVVPAVDARKALKGLS